jgi:NAD(P)-dependent dehydrogenase (short-subunit alcohol dehydrogenase family)
MSTPLTPGRTVVVTGAARGLGRALARELTSRGDRVVATARRAGDALIALDVRDAGSVARAVDAIQVDHSQVDVLVNNAAVEFDIDQVASEADLERVRDAFEVNVIGAWRVTQAMLPLLKRGSSVIMVSSELGSSAELSPEAPGYRLSKLALNGLTRLLAIELAPRGIDVRAVSPGWTATDMGGPGGRPIGDGVASIVAAIDAPAGTTGTYTQDGVPLAW